MPTLAETVAVLDGLYDPGWAQDWDAVGLVCGDPEGPVRRVLLAIDPVEVVAEEAIERGADLLLTHHPLFLRGVHGVPATGPKGRLAHRLIANGVALHVCHTNADAANPGVSDALAGALGLTALRPLDPHPADPERLGIGRIGALPAAEPLSTFADRVASALPRTAHGVRVAGDPARPVRTVAVSGGAGDAFLDRVRTAGVDAYLTADLRHHPGSEAREYRDGPALVDVAHWASEWPWLEDAASRLRAGVTELAGAEATVETHVSQTCTDPWTIHVGDA